MIILNYKPVLHQPTGIGVYANAVLPALKDLQHVIIPGGGSGGVKGRLSRLAWSQFQLPRFATERKADLIFTPAPEGYLGEQVVPQVVMVHDLRPLSHPECSMQSLYFKRWVPTLLRQCSHIITNSKYTASEIIKFIGSSESKLSVIPLGYDADHFCPSNLASTFYPRPYFLHVGQAYPHKNLKRLILAYSRLANNYPDVDLLLVGKPHKTETNYLQKLVESLGLDNRIRFIDYVKYSCLPDLYRGAIAFVFPSLWEGFGLPLLEAMACGTPVITSYGSATEEVVSSSALLIEPQSVDQIFSAMKEIMLRSELSKYLSRRGITRSTLFSWDKCRAETSDLMESLLINASNHCRN